MGAPKILSVEDIERNIRNQQIHQNQTELNSKPGTPINTMPNRTNLPMFIQPNADHQKNAMQRGPMDQRYANHAIYFANGKFKT